MSRTWVPSQFTSWLLHGSHLLRRRHPRSDAMPPDPAMSYQLGTCPECGKLTHLSQNDGRTVLSHSCPPEVYRDGRSCRGTGRVAIEKRKRALRDAMPDGET